MYTKAMAAFRERGCLHPVCHTHQPFAKLCVVKDKMEQIKLRTAILRMF